MYGLAILLAFSGAGIIFAESKLNKPVRHPSGNFPWGSAVFVGLTGIWLGLIFFSTLIFWLSWGLRAAGLDSLFALAPERLSASAVFIAAAAYIFIDIMRRRRHRIAAPPDKFAQALPKDEAAAGGKVPGPGTGPAGCANFTQDSDAQRDGGSARVPAANRREGSVLSKIAGGKKRSTSAISAFNKKSADSCRLSRESPLFSSLAKAPPRYLLILAIAAAIFAFWLLNTSFRESNGYLQAGASVFSDMAPHTALTSAFAKGANILPDYPHFAADGIRYHFFFYHLAGLLHAGGFSLALSLNLLTWLGIVSFILLLGLLAWRLTAVGGAVLLAPFLAMFRSSCAFFTFLASLISSPDNVSWGQRLLTHTTFIGNTPKEDWGLWSINVYANQRHFPAALALMLILLLLQTDNIRRGKSMTDSLASPSAGPANPDSLEQCQASHAASLSQAAASHEGSVLAVFPSKLRLWRQSLTDKSFRPSDPKIRKQQIITVTILFLLPFWHGSVFIAALMLLFCYAFISDNRFYLLSGAVLGLLYAFGQSKIFSRGALLSQNIFQFGFISEGKSPGDILAYILELTGILLPLLIIVFIVNKKLRLWMAVSSLPFIFSFFFSLTPDVTVNHKLIMISVMLWSIPLAKFLFDLPRLSGKRLRKFLLCAAAVLLIFVLTVSGLYECLVFQNLNEIKLSIPVASELSDWIEENTAPDAIFLTAPYSYNNFFLSGRRAWYGHPYYAWSAGHDTFTRESKLYSLTASDDPAEYYSFFRDEAIDAILVDDEARMHPDFPLNEEIIAALFPLAASFADEGNSRIYMVNDALLSQAPIHR